MAAEPLNDNWTTRLINSFLCITFYFELSPLQLLNRRVDKCTKRGIGRGQDYRRSCLESSDEAACTGLES